MTVSEKMARTLVKGFLHADGKRIVNGDGDEILLCGMGIGNWLVPEGYMWHFWNERCNSPTKIEKLIRQLCGSVYARYFWQRFRANYITEADVRAMAEAGFNSVRLPVHWRLFLEDEPGITWRYEGFRIVDRFLDWCEKWGLYVVLDLHCAPGGQTGSNIDDSADDIPRLFTDAMTEKTDAWHKTVALWGEFARRYHDRTIVGMYDLLNEPIKMGERLDLADRMRDLYRDCIAEIRKYDKNHMISIEGHQWAANPYVFCEPYDDNVCYHFHRYWCPPRKKLLDAFLDVRERMNKPLYLGESGENSNTWYAAMYPLCADFGIGYNIWCFKKMQTDNSPYSIPMPEGWNRIMDYIAGGTQPSAAEAQRIFDAFLENCKLENCTYNPDVIPSIRRRPGSVWKACDYTEAENVRLVDQNGADTAECRDSEMWEATRTVFTQGSFAEYHLYAAGEKGSLALTADFDGVTLEIAEAGEVCLRTTVSGERTLQVPLSGTGDRTVRITCHKGSFTLDTISYSTQI